MLTATLSDGSVVAASEVSRAHGPFTCPDPTCRQPMTLKQGSERVHHFAHQSASTCAYGAAESEEHMRAKLGILNGLLDHPDCTNIALERYLGTVRPDVSLRIRGVPVAIEVQRSNIELDLIRHRMAEYTRKGIYVLWVRPTAMTEHEYEGEDIVRPSKWEKFLHAQAYGRLYTWRAGATVWAVHLDGCQLARFSYARSHESGRYEKVRVGGPFSRAMRISNPRPAGHLHLADDFAATNRAAFEAGGEHVPRSRLWLDAAGKWW